MKDEILLNLDNPGQLEELYRADKSAFKHAFKDLYPQLKNNLAAGFWNERLNFTGDNVSRGTRTDLVFVIVASLLAGMIAKLPAILQIEEDLFYQRNIGFVIAPLLAGYFAWKNRLSIGKIVFIVGTILAGLFYINFMPDNQESDTLVLSCIHLLVLLWAIAGFAFIGGRANSMEKRLDYLKYNGDVVVMTTLILIAGAIMSGVTIGLFEMIGFSIEKFYFNYIGIFGLAAAPIVGTYLTQTNPQLVGKVSPVIARIFSPLVLVMLVVYLVAIIYAGKDPYNDRDFLLIFNALLIGVMAIIFFSVAETSKTTKGAAEITVLLLLSAVTIIVNGIALSAILFRISEWGITPNRAAVLGSNLLILVNLLLVTWQLFKGATKKTSIDGVRKTIAFYLPVYCIWAIIVTFLFPFIFGFK